MKTQLKAHPLADRLPMMTEPEFQALKASIVAANNKVLEKVVLLDGKILDGRNRHRVCQELEIDTPTEDFDPKKHGPDPVQFVISKTAHRNMTDGQKACVAESFMEDLQDARGIRGPGRPPKSRESTELKGNSSALAALRFGVAPSMVEQVRAIRKADGDLYREIFEGRLNVNQARNRLKLKTRRTDVRQLRPLSPLDEDFCRILEGDCIERMEQISTGTVRTVFADPPYNNGWKYHNDPTRDQRHPTAFVAWCAQWIAAAARTLAHDGSMFVLIDDNYSDFIGVEMRKAGLHRQGTIVWWETFANHTPGTFTCCTRFIHYYTKTPTFVFNRDQILVPSARQEKYDDARANPDGKVPDNVWQVARKQGTANDRVPFADAPPQLPIEIPLRCILASSNPGDAVLDPFLGNGTTAIAALKSGRCFIGCERSPLYAKQARKWIASQVQGEGADPAGEKLDDPAATAAAPATNGKPHHHEGPRSIKVGDLHTIERRTMRIIDIKDGNIHLKEEREGPGKRYKLAMPSDDFWQLIAPEGSRAS